MKEKLKYIVPSFWSVLTIIFATLLAYNHSSVLSIELYSVLIVLTLGLTGISSKKGFVAERFKNPESKIKSLFLFPAFTFFGAMMNTKNI